MSAEEYESLSEKDEDTLYIVKSGNSDIIENGVYIAYADGTHSDYDVLVEGKTPLGVALKTDNVFIVIHPSEGSSKQWSTDTSTVIEGVTTTTDVNTAKADYKGKENTAAVVASGLAGSAFTFATALGAD